MRMDNWNDDRLDELSGRVDAGFKEMRDGFTRVDREMKEGFAKVDSEMKAGFADVRGEMAEVRGEMRYVGERVDRLGGRVDRLGERVERLAHALMVGGISFALTALVTVAGLVVTQV